MNPELSIEINGKSSSTLFGSVVEIVVDTTIFSACMFTILFEEEPNTSGDLEYVDDTSTFKLGALVKIWAKVVDPHTLGEISGTLIKGEITAIEPLFREDGQIRLRIRGYDKAHRLMMGKKSRTFGDGNSPDAISEEEIIEKIAKENKLRVASIDGRISGLQYDHVMQFNQSDWDFLWSRARLMGCQVYVDGDVLYFEEAGKERGETVQLYWGENLSRFEPRIVSAGGATKTSASGWSSVDGAAARAELSSVSSKTIAVIPGNKSTAGAQIKEAFAIAEDTVINPFVKNIQAARVLSEARLVEHESQFVRAAGEVTEGDPRLLAGTMINVSNIGRRFSGNYYITEARHIYGNGNYKVQFQVSGRNPYTFRNILMGTQVDGNKIDGVVVGVVTDVEDPEKLGRVKVKYPWMPQYNGAELGSGYARVAGPGVGQERGIYFLPEVDDEVLIAFEQGDINSPYIVGALWSRRNKPPSDLDGDVVSGKKINQRVLRSRSGHVILLDDTEGKEKIAIQDKTGKNSILIDSAKNSMDIKVEGDLTIDVAGKFTVKSRMDLVLDSQAKLDMQSQQGASLKGSPTAMLDLQPSSTALKGSQVDIQGTAQTTVQGASTSVKGTAMVEVQAALVKIN